MLLLKETYTIQETVEIINKGLSPLPALNPAALSELVNSGAINVYVVIDKKLHKIVDGVNTIWAEHFMFMELIVKNDIATIEKNFLHLRSRLGKPIANINGVNRTVPILANNLVFKREDIQGFLNDKGDSRVVPTDKTLTPSFEQVSPIPIKGSKSSMQNWIKHVITVEKKLSLDEKLYAGLQQELINRAIKDYGYKDGTVVKAAWSALGLVSSHKNT